MKAWKTSLKKNLFHPRDFLWILLKLPEYLFYRTPLRVAASGLLKWQVKITEIIFKELLVARNCLRPESAPLRESDLLETTSFSL